MLHIDPQWVLTVVAVVMAILGLKDLIEARRVTSAVKARFLIVIIFVAVLIWLHWSRSPAA
ncbi:MAG: hypothetical protein KGL57_05245 [Burkholderiales bacterium]|nr:hypothetical protein [Burkholderiales bacterium]